MVADSTRWGSGRGRRRIALGATAVVLTLVTIALGARSYLFSTIAVEDLVAHQPGLGRATDVTDTYCANEIGCVEAWETRLGTYMRFGSRAEATHWATIFGAEGAQWEEFVLDTRGRDFGDEDRMTAVQILLLYDGV